MKKGFLVLLTQFASFTCQAGNYFFEPVFSADESYYSNLFLRQVPLQDNWITTLSPGVNFGLHHENGELKANFTWNQLFYTNQSELNIDEQLFSVDYHNKSERLQWGTSGSYNNQSNINTQGTVTGSEFFTQVMAKQLSLAPTLSYFLNELSSLTIDYSYINTTYDKNKDLSFFLADYDYHLASGKFSYFYTERDKLNATISGSRYKAKPPVQDQATTIQVLDQTTYNYVAQLGWQHSFSEQLITYLSFGMNYSQAESTLQFPPYFIFDPLAQDPIYFPYILVPASEDTRKNNQFGQVYQASVQKSFERSSVSLVFSQNQTPTSQGLQTQTEVAVSGAYTISERWTSGLSASYSNNVITGLEDSRLGSQFDRTYFSISPNISWKWSPEISLGLSYNFVQQDYENSTQPSQGNTVQLQFSYQPLINDQVK